MDGIIPMNTIQSVPVASIVFREDLYPRIKTNPEVVQRYADALEHLPPIEVNQHRELIDGWHRWTAHKKALSSDIKIIITETTSDEMLLKFAIIANAKHGQQLSMDDKAKMAQRLFLAKQATEAELIDMLSVSRSSLGRWLKNIKDALREEENAKILDMWFACCTHDEIADEVGLPRKTVEERLGEIAQVSKIAKAYESSEIPLYNVWAKTTKTGSIDHPGNSEPTWVDRLLYLYTEPGDIVIDPFAGSGSTIDVCRKRGRRYCVSDLTPIVEREKEIRQLDITNEMPSLTRRWDQVKLVYLDPPYWRQAIGMYGDSPNNFANMDLHDFHVKLLNVITKLSLKAPLAAIALIIQPTQWNAPERKFTDHLSYFIRKIDMPIVQRIQAPYSTQQYNAQMVDWAKEHRELLVLSREIIVWKGDKSAS